MSFSKGCHALKLSHWTILMLLTTAAAASGAKTATAAAAADGVTPQGAVCRLYLEGFGDRPGIKKAQLSCTGGSITAAADPALMELLSGTKGVVWSQEKDCQGAVKDNNCMLVVCQGSIATVVSPVIANITTSSSQGGTSLCVTGGSNVVLAHGTFAQGMDMRPLRVVGNGTTVIVKQGKFQGNNVTKSKRDGGALMVADTAKVNILLSTFVGNSAGFGGAIMAQGSAQVNVTSAGAPKTGRAGFTRFQGNNAGSAGGDICVLDEATVNIADTDMHDSSATYGGAVSVIGDNTATVMVNTRIINTTTKGGDGGGIAVSGHGRFSAFNCTIQGCGATGFGGAISAMGNATVLLVNSSLLYNEVLRNGGGVGAGGTSQVTLQNVTVQGNKASYGGAIAIEHAASLALVGTSRVERNLAVNCGGSMFISSDNFPATDVLPTISSEGLVIHSNNMAPDHADVCLSTMRLEFVSSNSSLDNFVASLDSDGGNVYALLNMSGPQGLPSSDPIAFGIFNDQNKVVGTQTLAGVPADYPHEGLKEVVVKIKQPPGDYLLVFSIVADSTVEPVELDLRIVPCPLGYITASSGDACSLCVRGYFSFDPTDKQCMMCVPNAECPGGVDLWPSEGFWHSAPRSRQMLRCINPSACLGNATLSNMGAMNASGNMTVDAYKTAQCAPAYQGNVCGDCKDGYGKVRPFLCRKCMSRVTIVMLYTVGALAIIGLIKLLMYFHHSSNTTVRKSLQEPISDELLKVLVLHGQWLYIISNLVNVPWPATLALPLQILNGIWSSSNGSSIGFECIFPRNAIPLSIQRVLFCLFTPVAIMFVVLIIEAIMYKFGPLKISPTARRSVGHNTKHKLASLVVAVVFLSLPTWVNTAFSLFTCMQLDRPASLPYQAGAVGRFWVADMQQQCYDGYHKAWAFGLGIPLLLLLCVVLPGGVFVFMWRSRKHGLLTDAAFERHYGFMYHLWREEVCWWEAVVVLQTIGLVMVATFGFALGGYYQGLVTGAVLGLIVMLLLSMRPFKCPAANTVAVQSACVLLMTSYTALTFLPYNGLEPGHVYGNIMGVVLLLLNVVFLAYTIWRLALTIDWSAAREALRTSMEKGCGVKQRKSVKAAGSSSSGGLPVESKDAGAEGQP